MVDNLLVCKNLSKTYKGVGSQESVALQDVSFSVKRGSILFVCGHNGSGKTTILKIIAGKVTSDDGKILFNDGSGLKKWDSFRSSNYVWVPQRLGDIITEYVKIHELVHISNKKRIIKLAKQIGANWVVKAIRKRKGSKLVGELSGGQKQLLMGLIALSESKPILLLDEVFRSLDVNTVYLYWDMVQTYIKESKGCGIIVTQDLKFAKERSTQLLVMKRNKKSFILKPSEISYDKLVREVSEN